MNGTSWLGDRVLVFGDETEKEVKTFTQEEVNTMMADHKRSLQKQVNDLNTELQNAKKSGSNTDALQAKIKELNDSLASKEELAKQEQQRIQREFEEKLTTTQQTAEQYRNRFTGLTMQQALTQAAIEADAFSPQQIIMLLSNSAEVVEKLDDKGLPTGVFETVVKMGDKKLPPAEALKAMKEDKQFMNLFKVTGVPGVGFNPGYYSGSTDNSIPVDTQEYMARRAELQKKGIL